MESDDFDLVGYDKVEKPYAQAKLLSATEKCPVCGDQAAKHVHYGASTCFSCRAFFRRSIQNKTADNYVCRRSESCEITPKTRKNCQFCRFQKCLSQGMKKSSVLTEEERNHRFRKTRDKKMSESGDVICDKSPVSLSLTEQLQGVSLNKQPSPTSMLNEAQDTVMMQQKMKKSGSQLMYPDHINGSHRPVTVTSNGITLAVNGKVDVLNGNSQAKSVLIGGTGRSVIVSSNGGLSRPPEVAAPSNVGFCGSGGEMGPLLGSASVQRGGLGAFNNQTVLNIKEEPNLSSPQAGYNRDCVDISPISPEDALGVIEKVPYDDISALFDSNSLDHALQLQESSSGESNLTSERFSDSRSPHEQFPEFSGHMGVYQNESAAPTPATVDSSATSTTDYDDFEDSCFSTYPGYNACSFDGLTAFESNYIDMLVREHNEKYVSINFGEELIKEMIMCSMFNIAISTSAAITGYQLCVQRMTRIAESLEPFQQLSINDRTALLKENSDLLVSLRAAIFFESSKKGLDQVLVSMGVEDMQKIKTMFSNLLEDDSNMKHIQYDKFNSLQKVEDKNDKEIKYNKAISKVAKLLSDEVIVVLMTLIILFSGDFCTLEDRTSVEQTQSEFVLLLRKYFNTHNSKSQALIKFANTLETISLIREMAEIKKSRKVSEKVKLPINS